MISLTVWLRGATVWAALSVVGMTAHAETAPGLTNADRGNGAHDEPNARSDLLLNRALAEALLARRVGNTGVAIQRLRDIVRARPDAIRARRILANLLFETEQYESAEFHFHRLAEDDPKNRASYNRALRVISARKPFGFGFSGSIVPSTNINRGTGLDTFSTSFGDFIINDESQATTGVGLALTGRAFRRFQVADHQRLQFDAFAIGRLYDKSEFNQHSYALRATWSHTKDRRSWAIAPEYSRAYVGSDLSYDRYAIKVSRGVPLGKRNALHLTARAEHRDYATSTYLTGQRYEVEASLRRRLNPRTSVEVSAAYKRGEPEAERFQYDGVEIGARVSRAFENGIQLGVGLSHEWRPYRGNFTGVTFPRDDKILTADFTVFNDRWTIRGAAPTFSCTYSRAASNIAFYDHSVQECNIGLTRAF